MAHLPISAESPGLTPLSEINNFGKLPAAGKAGRPKGSANKFTTDLKMMILGALHDAGGRDYLHKQAITNPTAFMGLVGKVLPTTLVGDPKRPIHVTVTEEERRREVDAAIDAVFGVYTETKLVNTERVHTQDAVCTIEHEADWPYHCEVCGIRLSTDRSFCRAHTADAASADSEPQAADAVEPDGKIVQLPHTKPHP